MIVINAMTALDLLQGADYNAENRSHACISGLDRFDPVTGTMSFYTQCSLSRNRWDQLIQFVDWEYLVPEELKDAIQKMDWNKAKTEIPELLHGDIKVDCNCPSFAYGGYHYIVDQLDSATVPEGRFPGIKNPELSGTICKHLASVLRTFFK